MSWSAFVILYDTIRYDRLTCAQKLTSAYVSKPSAIGQPTRPTQPFITSGSIYV